MQKYKMFKFVRELVEEVPGLEKWSLDKLANPADPDSTKVSPIKVAVMSKSFGEFQVGDFTLAITQEHRFGKPPLGICFSLPLMGVKGDSMLYGVDSGNLAVLDGEVGSSEGKMYQLPYLAGAAEAVIEWIEELSENTFWEV